MAREGQVSSGTFNMMSSTTTEKYNYFSQKFKGPQVEQKTNEPDIPCLKKGSEDTAKPSGPSQKISNNGPNSDTSKLTSGPSIANPTAISSFKKSNDAANTPKFTTQNAPNPLMNLNVNTN